MDFTVKKYKELLQFLVQQRIQVISLDEYFLSRYDKTQRYLILRHDIDRKLRNSVRFAQICSDFGISASFMVRKKYFKYFKSLEQLSVNCFMGYHYEDYTKAKKNRQIALKMFFTHIKQLAQITKQRILSVAAHGNPLSRINEKELFTLITAPKIKDSYLSIIDPVYYFTDTGRTWADDNKTNFYDCGIFVALRKEFNVKTTKELMDFILNTQENLYFTIHPERWNDFGSGWLLQYCKDSLFNIIKRIIRKIKK